MRRRYFKVPDQDLYDKIDASYKIITNSFEFRVQKLNGDSEWLDVLDGRYGSYLEANWGRHFCVQEEAREVFSNPKYFTDVEKEVETKIEEEDKPDLGRELPFTMFDLICAHLRSPTMVAFIIIIITMIVMVTMNAG